MDNKITMLVFNLDHGGAEKVCVTLCNEFVKLNYDIELWIVDDKKTVLSKILDKNITICNLNKNHVRSSGLQLLKLLIQRKPERILVFHIELAILVIMLKKLFFLKTKIFTRSINTLSQAYYNSKHSWRNYFTLKIIKNVLPYSYKIIAQSNGMREDLIRSFNIDNNKIVTIFNSATNFNGNKPEIVENTNIENDFLFVGRLTPQKGLINLLNAFKLAHGLNSNIHLTLVGEGVEKGKLKKMVVDLGLSHAVAFEGYQENTLSYFKRAKATVLSSIYEGFPNVLVESIAAGTPVISFDCPSGPDDIIVPGVNGILVPHLNVNEFANAILSIANGEIYFNKQEILNSANRFSLDTIVRSYESVLLEN